MSKALPWNVKTAGFDARNAAREAARRQGKSLGEWLHGVIADHAADLGVDEREMEGQQRINAVTSKLERLSARSADHDRRNRAARSNEFGRRRLARDRDSETEDRDETPRAGKSFAEVEGRRRHEAPSTDTTELLLEQAIEAMESRARRAEERTDNALQSFAKVLERNEAERNLERNSVNALTQKLSAIESRLGKEIATEANPIKGALERLEARLDSFGPPVAAVQTPYPQASARTKSISAIEPLAAVEGSPMKAPSSPRSPATFSRLEEKLNLILKTPIDGASRPEKPRKAAVDAPLALTPSAAVSPAAPAEVGPAYPRLAQKLNSVLVEAPADPTAVASEGSAGGPVARHDLASEKTEERNRGLGKAISDIMKRQRALEGDEPKRRGPPQSHPQTSAVETAQFAVMQKEIAALAATIDTLRQDVIGQKKGRTRFLSDIETIGKQIGRALQDLADRAGTSSLVTALRRLSSDLESARRRGLPAPMLQPVVSAITALRRALPQIDLKKEIEILQNDLPEIVVRIADFVHSGADLPAIAEIHDEIGEIRDLVIGTLEKSLETERLERQVVFIADCLDRQTHHPRVNQDLAAESDELRILMAVREGRAAIDRISSALSRLIGKVDQELKSSHPAPVLDRREIDTLETVVRELSAKLDAVQTPGVNADAFDALQQQVTLLSDRFERSDEGLAKLTAIERSISELFKHIEETREGIETTATKAARDVLRVAVEGRLPNDQATENSLAKIRALQTEAEARTTSTLSAVHGTLEKVVDRLAVMETDIGRTRGPAQANPSDPPTKPEASTKTSEASTKASATTSHLMEQMLGHRPGDEGMRAKLPVAAVSLPGRPNPSTVLRDATRDTSDSEGGGRSDFIAAARRAAQVAQADLDLRRPPVPKSSNAIRAGLIVTSRDYVARHKRPILLTIAALFVIAGTIQLIKFAGINDNDQQTAEVSAPAHPTGNDIVGKDSTAKGAPQKVVASATSLPMVALPPKTVSGTDPIQTGSTPNLPSFAAGGVSRAQPTIPQTLIKLAAAGSGAAQYALGVQYADGDLLPRDFARAAEWYQKAADQNIAPAEYRLASLYEKGLGVTQDKTKARALYLRAADAGNPRAMHNLAVLLADGDGKPDYEGAAVWFRKAAQYGVHDSQYNLAILLARGIGVKQSLAQSYQWFAIAAEQGDVDAAKKRDEVGTKLSASDIAVAKSLAATFHPRDPEPEAVGVQPPPGGWDGASKASPVNSPRPKISSL